MLGKVVKYEMRQNGRFLLPFFGLCLAGCVAMRLLMMLAGIVLPQIAADILTEVFIGVGGLAAVSIVVATVIYMLARFYQSMVGSEAYLTFTLPVKPSVHIAGRFLSSFAYACASVLLAVVCMWVISTEGFSMSAIINGSREITLTGTLVANAVGMVIVVVVALMGAFMMQCFSSCAVGSQFGRGKAVASFITYFVYHNVQGLLGLMALAVSASIVTKNGVPQWIERIGGEIMAIEAGGSMAAIGQLMNWLWLLVAGIVLVSAVLCTVHFLIARYCFSKRLNLD